jgi:Mce-associated membrane protein
MAVATHRPGRSVTEDRDGTPGDLASGTVAEPRNMSDDAGPLTPSSRGKPRWPMPAAIGLSVLIVVLLVVAVMFGAKAVGGFSTEHGRASALDAGRQAATNLTTFDFTTAEADVQRLKDSTTPTFENGFAADKDTFVKFLRDNQVKMSGEVTGAGLSSYDGHTAHVLVAIKAQTANNKNPAPAARNYRMDVSMVYQGGHWLANAAEFIS